MESNYGNYYPPTPNDRLTINRAEWGGAVHIQLGTVYWFSFKYLQTKLKWKVLLIEVTTSYKEYTHTVIM